LKLAPVEAFPTLNIVEENVSGTPAMAVDGEGAPAIRFGRAGFVTVADVGIELTLAHKFSEVPVLVLQFIV
jgi:hypothetical protein